MLTKSLRLAVAGLVLLAACSRGSSAQPQDTTTTPRVEQVVVRPFSEVVSR